MTTETASKDAILSQAATQARGLAIDAIHACSSGHLGLPLAVLKSAPHCSATVACATTLPLRSGSTATASFSPAATAPCLFTAGCTFSGYELSLEELKNFRQLGSETPGHPEFGDTVGVEATTGPLGQGIGNAVGYALSGKRAAAKFNTPEHTLFDHHVFALNGDGCLQEGVAKEAIAFAGHNQLDNLILIYDSNDVTLDAMADRTQSEDAEAYFISQGWDAVTIDGHDLKAVTEAVARPRPTTTASQR